MAVKDSNGLGGGRMKSGKDFGDVSANANAKVKVAAQPVFVRAPDQLFLALSNSRCFWLSGSEVLFSHLVAALGSMRSQLRAMF